MNSAPHRLPTLFIPHGGGPWPFIGEMFGPVEPWERLAAYLRGIDPGLGVRPRSVLVVSAHWEERVPTVLTGVSPTLFFDYYGFPEHTYRFSYPAPGATDVAARVRGVLASAGIDSGEDAERGYDHGVFIPLMLVYPEADVPITQLSLRAGLDPRFHLELGRALAPLRDEGVLIVGSGMSFHNMRGFLTRDARLRQASERFDAWLAEAVEVEDVAERSRRLAAWTEAPEALACHPRSEHLVPLFVAAGAALDDRGRRNYADHQMGMAVSGFQFG